MKYEPEKPDDKFLMKVKSLESKTNDEEDDDFDEEEEDEKEDL